MAKSQLRTYVFSPGIAGVGNIKLMGKYDLSQFLVITNTTKNQILYNFADATFSGTTVTFSRTADSNFPRALDGSDGITTLTFVQTTVGMSSTDQIQILYENPTSPVRFVEAQVDAWERIRVSAPKSMLDADFEYGLQPTKWQTISTMRNYPSVYEIPGTDTAVTSVVTDGSSGTGNVGASLITVTTQAAHNFTAGTPVTIRGYLNTITGFSRAEGTFIINSVPASPQDANGYPTTFTYYATAQVGTNGQTLSTIYTQLRKGAFYTGASIGSPFFTTYGGGVSNTATVLVAFSSAHGLVPGDTINVVIGSGGANHALAQGPFFVESTPTFNTFTYTTRANGALGTVSGVTPSAINGAGVITVPSSTFTTNQPIYISGTNTGTGSIGSYVSGSVYYIQTGGTGTTFTLLSTPSGSVITSTNGTLVGLTATASSLTGTVYSRPDTFYTHRPFDGGVQLGTGGPTHGAQAVRQSKKYIRYQSGKAINYNTGALFAPNFDIRSMTASGTIAGSTITVATDDQDHGCQVGATIVISGAQYPTTGYNGTYVVTSIIDERTLTYTALSALGATTAVIGSPCVLSVKSWYGAVVRAGTYDDQNGLFWQYDGLQVSVGRRSSTFQLAGTISINTDSNLVTGSSTRFTAQLAAGDRIVIRGMTHVVSSITDDLTMTVTPDYRGAVSVTGVKAMKTVDTLIPQSQFNMDKLDGSAGPFNPSGYLIDPTKMNMIGIQWTWYGAGFIDFMLRGPTGNYITAHRLRSNNLNNEAYMRSGNQPVRYEVINETTRSYLTTAMTNSDTTMTVADTTFLPSAGTIYVDNELISYTSKTSTTLLGLTRNTTFSCFNKGSNRTFSAGIAASHASGAGVILVNQTATPIISHWGSAFIQDGGFDEDRGYIFNYQATNINISTRKTTAFAIRLAPSVSNAIVGDLGVRELINRAQLLLSGIEITAGGTTNTNSAIVIEGVLNPQNYPTNVGNISWSGLNNALYGGQPSFAQIATGASVTFDGAATNTTTTPIALFQNATTGTTTVIPVASTTNLQVTDDVFVPTITNAIQGNTKISAINARTLTFSTSVATGSTASATVSTINGTTFTTVGTITGTFFIGMVLTGTGVSVGTYITGLLSGSGTATGSTWSVSVSQSVAATTITGTPYTLTAGAPTGGAIAPGTLLTGGSVTAGTYIIAYGNGTGGAGTYYLNQTYTGTPTGGSVNAITVTNPIATVITTGSSIQFSRNTYAVPGETIFSFVSSPSNKDGLDLTALKELTNTPIGGRGTFPNGPDVLMINVYLTQGTPVNSNLVLRWGEAQA
jgi:hypothetical protein